MAVPARIYEPDEERVPLRLIPGGKQDPPRKKAAPARAPRSKRAARAVGRQDARPFIRIFATVCVICCLLFVMALGPVFLMAQATRDSQQSVLIQESINEARTRSEQLEMKRSTLSSTVRMQSIATNQLGMVPAPEDGMSVELSPRKPAVAKKTAPAVKPAAQRAAAKTAPRTRSAARPTGVVKLLARLTAGQANTLLVGDVGLAATR